MVGAEGAEGGSQGAGAEAAEGRSRAEALRAVTKVPAPKVLRVVVKVPPPKALRAVAKVPEGAEGGSQGAGAEAEIKIGRPRHSLEKTTEVASCPAGQILVCPGTTGLTQSSPTSISLQLRMDGIQA